MPVKIEKLDGQAAVAKGIRYLRKIDPVMQTLIDRLEPFKLEPRRPYFEILIESIIYQQLAGNAAAAIFRRFREIYENGFPEPEQILRTRNRVLRSIGLSRQKTAYIKDLASKVSNGTISLDAISRLPDEDVIQKLIQVKGIGRWTAEMFLMFGLQRLDVWPVADLGIRKAIQKQYRMRQLPDPEKLYKIAEPWRPYRSIASWYLWKSAEVEILT